VTIDAQRVADDLAIRDVLARVAQITDGWKSMDEYVRLWTDDCTWESPVAGIWRGHEGHRARHERYRDAGVQGPRADSFHLVLNTVIDLDGDTATGRSTWLLVNETSTAPRIQDIGTYDDTLRRTPDGWKIARRVVGHASGGAWLRAVADTTGNA
jgi:hypothetical protein